MKNIDLEKAVYVKDFDKWNEIKKVIDQKTISYDFYFYEREIWWCYVGLNIGTEANGKNLEFERPVLIIKKFNGEQLLAIVLTSTNKQNRYYRELIYTAINNDSKSSFINLSQFKIISSKRLIKKIGTAEIENFNIIKEKIINLIK